MGTSSYFWGAVTFGGGAVTFGKGGYCQIFLCIMKKSDHFRGVLTFGWTVKFTGYFLKYGKFEYRWYNAVYFTGITTCIYTELAPKLTAPASVAQSVYAG